MQLSSLRDAHVIAFDEARIHIARADHARGVRELRRAAVADAGRRASTGCSPRPGSTPTQIDAVFLTGGSSQIPAVRQLFRDRFGDERLRTADAFTSVAEGLGRSARAEL